MGKATKRNSREVLLRKVLELPVDAEVPLVSDDAMDKALGALTYREREVIKLHWGIGGEIYTLEQIGEIFCVPRHSVRRVEAKALRKLQTPERRNLLVPN